MAQPLRVPRRRGVAVRTARGGAAWQTWGCSICAGGAIGGAFGMAVVVGMMHVSLTASVDSRRPVSAVAMSVWRAITVTIDWVRGSTQQFARLHDHRRMGYVQFAWPRKPANRSAIAALRHRSVRFLPR